MVKLPLSSFIRRDIVGRQWQQLVASRSRHIHLPVMDAVMCVQYCPPRLSSRESSVGDWQDRSLTASPPPHCEQLKRPKRSCRALRGLLGSLRIFHVSGAHITTADIICRSGQPTDGYCVPLFWSWFGLQPEAVQLKASPQNSFTPSAHCEPSSLEVDQLVA